MATSQSVEVKILGQKLTLKAPGADPEFAHEVAKLVSARLLEAESRIKTSAPHHVAVLALFTLAEEYLHAKQKVFEHQSRVGEKTRELIEWVEAEVK